MGLQAVRSAAAGAWIAILGPVAVVACLLFVAVPYLGSPGLYLDAVNPDYFAVKILHPEITSTVWTLPGNLIGGRFPILAGSIYHGSLQAYLAVPFTWWLGPSVATIRILYIVEALMVCLATMALIQRACGSMLLATICAALLAVDPAFVFAFRTQAYIVTAPVFFTLLACMLLVHRKPGLGRHVAAGALIGLAGWGYFVNLFVVPGIVAFVATRGDGRRNLYRSLAGLLVGLLLGLSPYLIAYALIFQSFGTVSDTLAWFHVVISDLHVATNQTLSGRVLSTLTSAAIAMNGDWIWRVIWGAWHTDYGQIAKLCLLVAVPLVALAMSARGSVIRPAAQLLTCAVASYVLVAMIFGGRMGGHHFVLLLPLLYALLGVSVALLFERAAPWRYRTAIAIGGCAMFLANVAGSLWTLQQLRTVEGVGLYADLVSDYPLLELQAGDRTPHIFMDWGGLMQFTYLTDGQIPAYGIDEFTGYGRKSLAQAICRFSETKIVFIGGADTQGRGQGVIDRAGLLTIKATELHDAKKTVSFAIFEVSAPAKLCG
jgi:hypothetical protein